VAGNTDREGPEKTLFIDLSGMEEGGRGEAITKKRMEKDPGLCLPLSITGKGSLGRVEGNRTYY